MSDSKETATPGDSNVMMNVNDKNVSAHLYREIVGSLIYASISTRPDITHATNIVSRFMSTPTATAMNAAIKILRYLKGSSEYGLEYNNDSDSDSDSDSDDNSNSVTITGYCDADWGGDRADRKSTTGYCVFVNNNLISWNTKKQQTVALSSAEAELMAIVEVTKEVKWMQALLTEMKVRVKKPIIINTDNQSAMKIAQHDIEHDRTKHIDIKHYFIRDEIDKREVSVQWVRTEQQVADIFTKPLPLSSFQRHRDTLVSNLTNK